MHPSRPSVNQPILPVHDRGGSVGALRRTNERGHHLARSARSASTPYHRHWFVATLRAAGNVAPDEPAGRARLAERAAWIEHDDLGYAVRSASTPYHRSRFMFTERFNKEQATRPEPEPTSNGGRCGFGAGCPLRLLAAAALSLGLWLAAGTGRAADSAASVSAPAAADLPAYQVLPPLEGEGWKYLFDGKSLEGWKVSDFAGHGAVEVKNGQIQLEMGAMLTGVNLVKTNDIPKHGYELALDTMKVDGSDFFCGLTFVVGDSCCSLIVGGWGGGVVGISSLDGNDASSNETTKFKEFEKNKWFRIRVRVTKDKLEAWLGKEKIVDVLLADRRIGVRPGEIEASQPFGIAAYQTTAALRNIQWRPLPPNLRP